MHGKLTDITMNMTMQGAHTITLTYVSPLSWLSRDPENVFSSPPLMGLDPDLWSTD